MNTKKIITLLLLSITISIVLVSGFLKVIHLPWSVEGLNKFNLPNSATVLGLMEMSFALLFVIPKTMRIGFILLSCYFAGAMATELSHDGSIFNPGIPLTLIWITAYLRDKSIFFNQN